MIPFYFIILGIVTQREGIRILHPPQDLENYSSTRQVDIIKQSWDCTLNTVMGYSKKEFGLIINNQIQPVFEYLSLIQSDPIKWL